MSEVSIKALKTPLGECVRAAAAGETVLVTDRGRVVAELIAPRACDRAPAQEQRLGELARQGLLAPAKISPRKGLPLRRPVSPLTDVLRDLDDSRSER